jgi:hypothetical protein
MPVTLHWFLPTTGDSRTIVGVERLGRCGALPELDRRNLLAGPAGARLQ